MVKLSLNGLAPIVLISLLAGCASIPKDQRTATDPWESLNRGLYSANVALDNVTLKPLSKGYRKVLPGPIRTGVSNFFRNLTTPASALNNFLQAKPANGVSELGRFLFNSTLGIGGLLDIASDAGMEKYQEDFGQTLAVWGIPDGPYVILPFLGPKTLRDAVTTPLDLAANPLFYYEVSSVRDPLTGLGIIDLRYRLLSVEQLLKDSKDPYVTTRESYLQNRVYEIHDGDPPEDDDFFDEFLEEDDAAGN